jgi:hypothetical protein
MRRAAESALLALIISIGSACTSHGIPRLTLPSGPGTPAPEYATAFGKALIRCYDVRTFSAELSLSGHIGNQKLRGHVLVGLAPGALRLEAVAPGGAPAFVMVADGNRGRLLLSHDRRVLDEAAPAEILDALVGIALGPDDLRALLSGCVRASAEPVTARSYEKDWMAVDLAGGGTVYLRPGPDGTPRIVAGSYAGLTVQYADAISATPPQIHLTSPGQPGRADLDLILTVSQVETNIDLPRDRLVALTIPPGTSRIDLQELRESYHH